MNPVPKIKQSIIAAAAAIVAVTWIPAPAMAGVYDCTPQCVPSARTWSGVNFPRVEYAKDIPAAAKKAGFKVTPLPPFGQKSAGVIGYGKVDHAIAVTKATLSGTTVKLTVSHSNYDGRCSSETATATLSGGKITFTSGALKGKPPIPVRAFIW
jgi:hypothetical protein